MKTTDEVSIATLEEYQAKLDALMAEDSSAIFANYSREHAGCIIKTFLAAAQKSADILAGDFGNDFYRQDTIKNAILKAVSNGAQVRIISLGTDDESKAYVREMSTAAKAIPVNGKGGFLFKFARVRPGAQVKHYMVVDNKRYRLEDYHTEGSDTVHAEVCCNGAGKAAVLLRSFNNVWDALPNPA